MPIDINHLRAERGGDPAKWRDMVAKRFKPVALVEKVMELDQVSEVAQQPARACPGRVRETASCCGTTSVEKRRTCIKHYGRTCYASPLCPFDPRCAMAHGRGTLPTAAREASR
jgi:hypothetical protein